MSDEAFKELMGRMHSAVDTSKTARENVKTASVEDLTEPGDILANQIHSMNDDFRREHFPEEVKTAEAEDEDDLDKEAVDYDGDGDEDDPESVDPDLGNLPNEEMKEKALKRKKELNKGEKKAGFGLSVEEDLNNPFVALGFNAELKEHEPAIKQAVAKIVQSSAVVGK